MTSMGDTTATSMSTAGEISPTERSLEMGRAGATLPIPLPNVTHHWGRAYEDVEIWRQMRQMQPAAITDRVQWLQRAMLKFALDPATLDTDEWTHNLAEGHVVGIGYDGNVGLEPATEGAMGTTTHLRPWYF